MPTGHTKFTLDWCLGLLKQHLKLCEVHCLTGLRSVVESSTTRGINNEQMGGTEDDEFMLTSMTNHHSLETGSAFEGH